MSERDGRLDRRFAGEGLRRRYLCPVRIGVLASGSGTILEAILSAGIPVEVVVVDRLCRATEVAESHGVGAALVHPPSYGKDFDRVAYTNDVIDVLDRHGVALAVMAGFGTIFEK